MIELNKTYKDKSGNDVRIICVDRKHQTHPIVGLTFDGASYEAYASFTEDGRFNYGCASIYDLILPEDYSTFKVDEPVMVRNRDNHEWQSENFAGVRDGKASTWVHGTKWASDGGVAMWNQCRRPTKEELGEK